MRLNKPSRKPFDLNILKDAISRVIGEGQKKVRWCPHCGQGFKVKSMKSMKYFCSSSCYGTFHRIPGMFRKLRKEWD